MAGYSPTKLEHVDVWEAQPVNRKSARWHGGLVTRCWRHAMPRVMYKSALCPRLDEPLYRDRNDITGAVTLGPKSESGQKHGDSSATFLFVIHYKWSGFRAEAAPRQHLAMPPTPSFQHVISAASSHHRRSGSVPSRDRLGLGNRPGRPRCRAVETIGDNTYRGRLGACCPAH